MCYLVFFATDIPIPISRRRFSGANPSKDCRLRCSRYLAIRNCAVKQIFLVDEILKEICVCSTSQKKRIDNRVEVGELEKN